jgi:hypothetical protein
MEARDLPKFDRAQRNRPLSLQFKEVMAVGIVLRSRANSAKSFVCRRPSSLRPAGLRPACERDFTREATYG